MKIEARVFFRAVSSVFTSLYGDDRSPFPIASTIVYLMDVRAEDFEIIDIYTSVTCASKATVRDGGGGGDAQRRGEGGPLVRNSI